MSFVTFVLFSRLQSSFCAGRGAEGGLLSVDNACAACLRDCVGPGRPPAVMGCCSSSQAGADQGAEDSSSKMRMARLSMMSEVSVTKNLSLNCNVGHPLEKYDVLEMLGTGGFAVVKRVRDKVTSLNYAMKVINVSMTDRKKKAGLRDTLRNNAKKQ